MKKGEKILFTFDNFYVKLTKDFSFLTNNLSGVDIMKTIKTISVFLCLLLIISLFAGCGEEKNLTLKEISGELERFCLADKETYEVTKSEIENIFNFDGDVLKEYSIKISDSEEKYLCVALFTPAKKENKQTVIDGINSHLKILSSSFEVLRGNEQKKFQERLFYEYNDTLILVVADDYKKSKEYLEEIGASPVKSQK